MWRGSRHCKECPKSYGTISSPTLLAWHGTTTTTPPPGRFLFSKLKFVLKGRHSQSIITTEEVRRQMNNIPKEAFLEREKIVSTYKKVHKSRTVC
jgi:hypothetical protein